MNSTIILPDFVVELFLSAILALQAWSLAEIVRMKTDFASLRQQVKDFYASREL